MPSQSSPRQPGSFKPWSSEDDAKLAALFNADELTVEQIAATLGRSGSSVRARLGKLRKLGDVGTKRQGTRRKVPASEQPTNEVDVAMAIDLFVDTNFERRQAWTRNPAADMALFNERYDNARKHLEDVLRRFRR
jgi:hypothetical protein